MKNRILCVWLLVFVSIGLSCGGGGGSALEDWVPEEAISAALTGDWNLTLNVEDTDCTFDLTEGNTRELFISDSTCSVELNDLEGATQSCLGGEDRIAYEVSLEFEDASSGCTANAKEEVLLEALSDGSMEGTFEAEFNFSEQCSEKSCTASGIATASQVGLSGDEPVGSESVPTCGENEVLENGVCVAVVLDDTPPPVADNACTIAGSSAAGYVQSGNLCEGSFVDSLGMQWSTTIEQTNSYTKMIVNKAWDPSWVTLTYNSYNSCLNQSSNGDKHFDLVTNSCYATDSLSESCQEILKSSSFNQIAREWRSAAEAGNTLPPAMWVFPSQICDSDELIVSYFLASDTSKMQGRCLPCSTLASDF